MLYNLTGFSYCLLSTVIIIHTSLRAVNMVVIFNATFNNISCRSVLLVEETGVPGEVTTPMCVFLLVTPVLSQVSDQSYVCVPFSDTCPKPGK